MRNAFSTTHWHSMHSALKVQEVLCLIFEDNLDKHNLFNCSLVCRLWAIWASEALWRTSDVPLRAVLRPLARNSSKRENGEEIASILTRFDLSFWPNTVIPDPPPHFMIRSIINEHSWRQFLGLASKVTKIVVDCRIWGSGLERIELAKQTFGGEPFSRLRTLKTTIHHDFHEANELVTVPTLSSVNVSCDEYSMWDEGVTWVNARVPAIAPQITRFCVMVRSNRCLNLSQYSSLRVLELHDQGVRPSFWASLSGCQQLRKVVLISCRHYWTTPWGANAVHFPALRTLEARNVDQETVTRLVLRSRMPMLERFWWDGKGPKLSNHGRDRIAGHLKQYSPMVDTDMLFSSKQESDNIQYRVGSDD